MPREKRETVPLMVRLSPDVHAAVSAEADADLRSLNAEIDVLLREAIAAREKKRGR